MNDVDTLRIIDLKPWWTGGEEERGVVAEAIGQACEEIGFFIIVNHGIDTDLIARCRALAVEFFDLPSEEKLEVAAQSGFIRGFQPIGTMVAGYGAKKGTPGELREDFAIGPLDPAKEEYFTGPQSDGHFAPNRWPRHPESLRESWSQYYRAMEQLSDDLAEMFARALGLSPDFFEKMNDRHISMLKVVNYPAQIEAPAPGEVRIREHGDLGDFTILHHEKTPGSLEVKTRSGQWIEVPEVPDSFVINIGDLMMMWTNDKWVSTKHRVQNPPRELAQQSRRMSMPYFHQPNYDAVISCIPTCHGAGNPARYGPITSGQYLKERYSAGKVADHADAGPS